MKDFKRKLYAIALAGLIMSNSNIIANAEGLDDVDMTPIDINDAIIQLVPDDNGGSNNSGSDNNTNDDNNTNNNNNNNNTNTNDNNNTNNNTNTNTNDNNNTNNNTNTNTSDNNNTNNNTNTNTSDNNNTNNNTNTNTNDNNNTNNNTNNNNNNNNTYVDNNSNGDTKTNNCQSHRYNSAADDVTNQVAPSCDKGGSYTEIYYCLDCGYAKNVDVYVNAPGHNWSEGEITNRDQNGYDIQKHCTNKGCNDVTHEHVETIVPTEPKPTEPKPTEKPTEPKPTEPKPTEKPTEPKPTEKPTEPTRPTGPVEYPKTGDDSHIEFYSGLLVASGLGLGIMKKIADNNKRKNNNVIYEPKFLDGETIADKKVKKYKGKYLTRK